MTHNARTRQALLDAGWAWVEIVEGWGRVGMRWVRRDLAGIIDILAMRHLPACTLPEVLGVQACAMDRRADHMRKLQASPATAAWLATGARLELWSWSKKKIKRGGVAVRWEPTVTEITAPMLEAVA